MKDNWPGVRLPQMKCKVVSDVLSYPCLDICDADYASEVENHGHRTFAFVAKKQSFYHCSLLVVSTPGFIDTGLTLPEKNSPNFGHKKHCSLRVSAHSKFSPKITLVQTQQNFQQGKAKPAAKRALGLVYKHNYAAAVTNDRQNSSFRDCHQWYLALHSLPQRQLSGLIEHNVKKFIAEIDFLQHFFRN